MELIDKSAVVAEIEDIESTAISEFNSNHSRYSEAGLDICHRLKNFLDTLEVKEVNKEHAEAYLAKFDEKFPIIPTLKGKQLADYKNFLNKCQQIFGLQEWGIYPAQSKLFEKLTLLWATWGAEHLQGIGQPNGEFDRCSLTWQDIQNIAEIGNDFLNSEESNNLNDEEYYTGILKRFIEKKESGS